jgi:excisionase family DNA binding protein
MTNAAPRRRSVHSLLVAVSLYTFAFSTNDAFAGGPDICERPVLTLAEAAALLRIDANELERLARQHSVPGRRVGSSWRFNCTALLAWLIEDTDAKRASTVPAPSDVATSLPRDSPSPIATQNPRTDESTDKATTDQPGSVGEPPNEKTAEDVSLRGHRVLLGAGEIVAEIGQFYSRSDEYRLTAVNGAAVLSTLEQSALTTVFLGRIGVVNETELVASAALQERRNRELIGSVSLDGGEDTEFGNVNIGVRHTLVHEGAGNPDIIGTVDAQIATGTSPYAAGGGLVFVKGVDPVALFASAYYLHLFGQDLTRVGGENRFSVSIGYSLALNDTLAISTSFYGSFAGNATLGNVTFRRPSTFTGRLALTSSLTERLYIEPSVSFGLAGPGGNFSAAVTIPYSF